jgi:hypothetical protein
MAVPWATHLLHFHLNKLFRNVFCILALFGLATVLATFQKIGQFYSKSSCHPGSQCRLFGYKIIKFVNKEGHHCYHGQALVIRAKLGPSFQR